MTDIPSCIHDGCENEAKWILVFEVDEDTVELMESCTDHVGALLREGEDCEVYPLDPADYEDWSDVMVSVSEIQTCPKRMAQAPHGERMYGMDTWETDAGAGFQRCSYCESIRPEDALLLVKDRNWKLVTGSRDGEFYLLASEDQDRNTKWKSSHRLNAWHCTEQMTTELLETAFGGRWVRDGDHFRQMST